MKDDGLVEITYADGAKERISAERVQRLIAMGILAEVVTDDPLTVKVNKMPDDGIKL